MGTVRKIPDDWTKPERWVWAQIAAGEPADLNARGPGQTDPDPHTKKGWGEDHRLSSKFLETILTQKAFVEATPYGGVRIVHALIDDAPLHLENARLQHLFWLEKSRILIDVSCRNLRVDGGLSLAGCFVAAAANLGGADIRESTFLTCTTFKGGLNLVGAKIGSNLEMDGSSFEGDVNLSSATVGRSAFLRAGANFKGGLDLGSAKIGSNLEMDGSSFEGDVNLSDTTVSGSAFLRAGANFKGGLDLRSAKIGSNLEMDGSSFEGNVSLNSTTVGGTASLSNDAIFKGLLELGWIKIGSTLQMQSSTFERYVTLSGATVNGSVFLRDGTIFKSGLNLGSARIGSNLEMHRSSFEGGVDLTGCTITGDFLLGFSEFTSARWEMGAWLKLRNTHVGALQGWWRDESANSWPKTYQLEGFTYDRLGSIGEGKEAGMLDRPVISYIQWLGGDPGSSPQPYTHLADRFHEAGEPVKANSILYAARERRRRKAWSMVGDFSLAKIGKWLQEFWRALGLSVLRWTIGYGLGNRYFRVLWWVGGLTLVGAFVLIVFGSHSLAQWPRIFFASLDQLLPIITLDKGHDVLIFGDSSAKPPVNAQPYGVLIYFFAHKILGWVLGSFLVAGLTGLTQRN